MVIDSSAVVGVIRGEASAPRLAHVISRATRTRISAATLVESSIVMVRYLGKPGLDEVDHLLNRFEVSVEVVTAAQASIARTAFVRFGKGRHRAALNLGDCSSYALARDSGEPLLCLGDDFVHTDFPLALA